MNNAEIAARFTRIADILEIQGENFFKVKAYRNAAATILDLDEPLSDLDKRGVLTELPGFGEAIVGKTRDFLSTGTTALYERIKNDVPEGVVQMARIPGLSPKSVKTLTDALGVSTVDELEAAARAEKVRDVAGFGAAKEAKLLENIARWRRLSETLPLYLALALANRYADAVRAFPETQRVEVCGEIRRGCETVSGVYLLVDTPTPIPALQAAAQLPGVTGTLDKSSSHITLATEAGVPLTVATYDAGLRWSAWGFAHLAATGSAEFYESLEPGNATNTVSLATEADVFAAMGLPFIPPELRDTPGIVQTVRENGVPMLITVADFRGQLHEHSTGSDGAASIREMAEAALMRGYEYLAITDHSRSLTIANGMTRALLEAQITEIADLNREFVPRGLTLLSGIEADILQDGAIDCEDDLLARLDIVVASVHRRYSESAEAMTARIVRAIEHPHVHIIGHPTGRLLGRREPFAVDMGAVIDTAKRTGTILEINAAPERLDLSAENARAVKEAGVLLSINADAHSVAGLDSIAWGVTVARRAGLSPGDVVNTFDLATLRAALKNGYPIITASVNVRSALTDTAIT
ncbi:MAG: hypothetical protein H7Y38_05600 [Armatimonadetes bacterium]|nr:hypothetical protein [Armatimonadota bacterium]